MRRKGFPVSLDLGKGFPCASPSIQPKFIENQVFTDLFDVGMAIADWPCRRAVLEAGHQACGCRDATRQRVIGNRKTGSGAARIEVTESSGNWPNALETNGRNIVGKTRQSTGQQRWIQA